MAFCSNCGNQLNENERFCSVCGTPCEAQPQPQPEEQPQAPYTPSEPQPVQEYPQPEFQQAVPVQNEGFVQQSQQPQQPQQGYVPQQNYQQQGYGGYQNNGAQGGQYNGQYQQPYQNGQYPGAQPVNATVYDPEDKPSVGLEVLSFFIPLVGLILFCVYNSTKPKSAKGYGKFALIGFLVGVVLAILVSACSACVVFSNPLTYYAYY